MASQPLSLLYAFEGFEKDLSEELRLRGSEILRQEGRLFLATTPSERPVWAQVHAPNATLANPKSISESAKVLKSLGGRWACASPVLHRRSHLIEEQIPRVKPVNEIEFLSEPPSTPWGLWGLFDESTLVASTQGDSPFPLGEVKIKESTEPPSRAYMKLWEFFTMSGQRPPKGARTMDLGSSPGGWTWVLAQMGCHVVSVDKADLAPNVARSPLVKALKKDAFKVKPDDVAPVDWLFSDLICYPPKLYELVEFWRDAGVRNFVCTIKFQGQTDFETMRRFQKIPGSRVVHLCANKHEVTWILVEDSARD